MAKEKSDKTAKKPRATKSKKDPNAPKKNQSAYMIFCNENRPIVKEENPEATFGEMGKLLGAKWKELDEAGKKPYNDKAEADKGRYERDLAEYESKGGAAEEEDE